MSTVERVKRLPSRAEKRLIIDGVLIDTPRRKAKVETTTRHGWNPANWSPLIWVPLLLAFGALGVSPLIVALHLSIR